MELIKIDVNAGQEAIVSGRELHKVLEIGTEYAKWFSRMVEYGFVEDQDFAEVIVKNDENSRGGRPSTDHAIKLDMAKEIAMIQRTEKGKQVRQYFIECEKKLKLNTAQLSPHLQAFNQLFQAMANMELGQKKLEGELQGIRDAIVLDPAAWRVETTNLINKIAMKLGGYENIKAVRKESYEILDSRAKSKLGIRQINMKRKVLEETGSRSKADKITKLDVIASDARLREVYIAIIKEMSVKYGVA
jgi:anti-repressor protein|nr:MAG TPA: AntA/AntB antirepressor [Caudoviricetes sp.]